MKPFKQVLHISKSFGQNCEVFPKKNFIGFGKDLFRNRRNYM